MAGTHMKTAASEIEVLQEITSAVVRERNVRRLLEQVLEILERKMGMLRGTFCLLEGDELRIEASTSALNAEERANGRYRIGEGITGIVAQTGRPEVVPDIRRDRRFLNRTGARAAHEALSFVCVPLTHLGQVIGTLSVDRAMRGDTTQLVNDVALLGIIANITAEAAQVCREERAEHDALIEENRQLRDMLRGNPGRLIGNCREMRAVYEQIRQIAPSDATVLIRGASGTGKELVARAIQGLSPPAVNMLLAYKWPGNVRELENCIEHAVLTAKDECVHSYNLPPALQLPEFAEDPFRPDDALTLDAQLAAVEKRILAGALARHNGNRSAAGRELGISPRMMNYRLNRAGLA